MIITKKCWPFQFQDQTASQEKDRKKRCQNVIENKCFRSMLMNFYVQASAQSQMKFLSI